MAYKLMISLIIASILIVSSFFVTAIVFNQDSTKDSEKIVDKSESLKLLPTQNSEYQLSDEKEDDVDEKNDVSITGNELQIASKIALDYIGEGKVTDTEVGDEEGFYEIEITLDNGKQVDVHLNKDFKVLGKELEEFLDEED